MTTIMHFWDIKIIAKGSSIEEIRQQILQTINLDILKVLEHMLDVNDEILKNNTSTY